MYVQRFACVMFVELCQDFGMPRTSQRPQSQVRRNGQAIAAGAKGLRTKMRILEEARRLLLEKGYEATTIGDIADASGIRRASFYTYFTSKHDILLQLGADAEHAGIAAVRGLRRLSPKSTVDDVAAWVDEYFAFWDEYGAFVHAAFQASYTNADLRDWSLDSEMAGARVLGKALTKLRGGSRPPGADPTVQGLALQSMMERFWYHWRVAGAPVAQGAISRSIAHIVWSSAHAPIPARS